MAQESDQAATIKNLMPVCANNRHSGAAEFRIGDGKPTYRVDRFNWAGPVCDPLPQPTTSGGDFSFAG